MLLRSGFEFTELFQLLNDVFHDLTPFFDVGILSSAEHHGNLDFVLVFQEANRLLHLEVDIMFTRLGAQANLFGLRSMTVLILFLLLIVFVLTKVHNTTDGRSLIRCDLNQIEAHFASLGECVVSFDNSQRRAVIADDAERRDTDLIIDPR